MSDPKLPCELVMKHISKLSIEKDKPIMLDYWTQSLAKTVVIGVREGGEKLLVKNEDEYTSPISKVYKVGDEFILITENSIYLVSSKIQSRKIT